MLRSRSNPLAVFHCFLVVLAFLLLAACGGGGLAGELAVNKPLLLIGILGSVLGKPFDAATQSAIELGKALENPTNEHPAISRCFAVGAASLKV